MDTIKEFIENGWNNRQDNEYIIMDVVYPDCCVQHLIFTKEDFDEYSEYLGKSDAERLVWAYRKLPGNSQ
jgi:hypothetical protein